MSTVYRRRSDNAAQRILRMFIALAIALSGLSCYISYRAIRAMDAMDEVGNTLFKMGRASGRASIPESMER